MRLYRMTTRRLMFVVLIVGIICGVQATMKRRREALRLQAQYYAAEIQDIGDENSPDPHWEAYWYSTARPFHPIDRTVIEQYEKNRERRLDYHVAMYKKYQEAALRPWYPIAADLPPPARFPEIKCERCIQAP